MWLSPTIWQMEEEKKEMPLNIKTLDMLWDKLGDIPINGEDRIEINFCQWLAGTDKEDIWHWFDEQYLQGLGKRLEERCEEYNNVE